MKVAIFKNLVHDFDTVVREDSGIAEHGDYIRLTEWTDVEFEYLPVNPIEHKTNELAAKERSLLEKLEEVQAERARLVAA
jgi:hypothetical protein